MHRTHPLAAARHGPFARVRRAATSAANSSSSSMRERRRSAERAAVFVVHRFVIEVGKVGL
jgi:hypothetical protein